ncbi:DUF1989 domain-containing protein [Conexibacter woesei]|uniref:DUF1989 domain-containing protein n=1 Tax=Conexibacter woesei (strain DSM 14684 / CCUG 47730 / CIP 108061 / JCM 11494 / NBRC 100937 / ID131577) TaxID=469383 RepID=D3F6I7_CONWI|nr:urea carboxylase-associated family protein [Conexibacter woesei]ADB50754.1 Domain of unknown function DUF1989 [Conexibacter woesei DSM 14684]
MSTTATSIVIAPQSGGAVFVKRGQHVRVTDVRGRQVADTWAIDAADPTRWLSAGHTLSLLCRLFPQVGESFVDQRSEPILRLHHDTSPGPHDMLYPPCDPVLYEASGPDHPSCETNFTATVATLGLDLGCIPNPVNLFQNSEPQPDRTIDVIESKSRPGDYVELVAERDLHVIVTACSVDNYATNGWNCTEVKLEVLDA